MDSKKLEPPPLSLLDKYRGREFDPLYTTTVAVSGGETGHGRASGVVRSDDGKLVLDLRLPNELGGPGTGTNPEQLFAASFAACFHGVLNLLGHRAAMEINDAIVEVQVSFGRDPIDGGYGLVIEVRVRIPGIERRVVEELVRNAERICPYAKMAKHGAISIATIVD
ncbi:peroxiredoxin [Paraburkholderia ginsengiterrae]|uniref:Peroxiredoxin n=1 Tax=Paraburkholderia ginsengiterrae TaxID=1462993 RepID=A0A1A9NFI5_9BURK|nr:Ohr family peroxiredoxin [Paraburkholderia ginsengiterrae]OAJ61724.1 peroxiredoxin [Paraburkholderia ginsengiterrae]OAJ65323.1 peroxiredoxin [Paraburkholderia ginsengiterrae]